MAGGKSCGMRQFAGPGGGHRDLREDQGNRSGWAQANRLVFLCNFFFFAWSEKRDANPRKVIICSENK